MKKSCVLLRRLLFAPRLKLMLPEVIYALPGIESNIYFKNVIDSAVPESFAVEVLCEKGTQGGKRWFWTPSAEDAGKEFELELRLFNDHGMIASAVCKIKVAAEQEDRTRRFTLALLADSGAGSRYPDHMLNVMRERGYVNYTPVGTHSGGGKPAVPGGIAHDGYGGFTWKCFLDRWLYGLYELPQAQSEAEREQMLAFGVKEFPEERKYLLKSPLLKVVDGKKIVDIPGWLGVINQGQAPDFIVIQLGGNDMFHSQAEQLKKRVKTVMGDARRLISELRKYAPDAVMGIVLGSCGCGQDGFGANYGCMQSAYQFKRNILCYQRALMKLVKGLKDPRISLVPIRQAIDPDASYRKDEYPAHARSGQKVMRFSNALHPTKEGGYQLGDAMTCWLINQLEEHRK